MCDAHQSAGRGTTSTPPACGSARTGDRPDSPSGRPPTSHEDRAPDRSPCQLLHSDTHLLGVRLRVGALRIGERPIPIPAARSPHQQGDLIQRRGLTAGPLTDDVIRLRHPATVLPTNEKKPPRPARGQTGRFYRVLSQQRAATPESLAVHPLTQAVDPHTPLRAGIPERGAQRLPFALIPAHHLPQCDHRDRAACIEVRNASAKPFCTNSSRN